MLYDTVPAEARRNDALDDVRSGALDRARWLLDLLDRGRAEFRLAFGTRKGDYRRLEELHAGIRAEIDEGLATRSDDELRAAALSLLLVARPDGSGVWHYRDRVASLISRRRGWTSDEVAVMLLRVGEYRAGHWLAESLGAVLDAVDRLDTDGRRAVTPTCARRTEGSWSRKSARRRVDSSAGACARCWRTRTPPCRTS
ncbi:hypothetical protein [Actinacidiphila glaucinigra]|uniref:hypothetical protein n=1 Tax=Actinacidiphila glaucinigra TaxID=235986 RepID=UPI003D8D9D01